MLKMYHSISLTNIAMTFLAVSAMTAAGDQNDFIDITCNDSNETSELCWTLSEFAANISQYNSNNFFNVLLEPAGKHILSTNLTLSNMIEFNLMSSNDSSYAEILCVNDASLHFSDSQEIYIAGVHFHGCGGNSVENVTNFEINDAIFDGNNSNGTALQLTESNAIITDCNFSFNSQGAPMKIRIGDIVIPQVPRIIEVDAWAGGALAVTNTSLIIENVRFENNLADIGGAIFLSDSDATINNSTFVNNQLTSSGEGFSFGCNDSALPICADTQITAGGALFLQRANVSISNSTFCNNSAAAGGVIFAVHGELHFSNKSVICENFASTYDGGAIHAWHTTIEIDDSCFYKNIVKDLDGGAMYCYSCDIEIYKSSFSSNHAVSEGGGLFLLNGDLTISGSEFANNMADFRGGAVYTYHSKVNLTDNRMIGNTANTGAAMIIITCDLYSDGFLIISDGLNANISTSVHLLDSTFIVRGNFTFSNNSGTMIVFNTYVSLERSSTGTFRNNHQQADSNERREFQNLGGAITLFQSTITFLSESCKFENNTAENGGAIHSVQSKIFVIGEVLFVSNSANRSGGSMYMDQSELSCEGGSSLIIQNSSAAERGGGIHVISTSIKANASSNFTLWNNYAENGGGISLETNSKVYILKSTIKEDNTTLYFIRNSANYGGAIFVNDDTYAADACADSDTECFFQVFTLYQEVFLNRVQSVDLGKSFDFQDNQAYVHGSSLFGGFLNRCTMSPFVGIDYSYNGSDYFDQISTGDTSSTSISSRPVQLCSCDEVDNNNARCKHVNPSIIEVKKGQVFNVSLIAVDQIGEPVRATIQSGLTFNESGLAEGQLRQTIPGKCTELSFNVISSQNSEKLILYASDGPCKDTAASLLTLEIQFLPCSCPVGFQPSGNSMVNCTCECHRDVAPYVSKCDTEAESILRYPHSKAWISSILQENNSEYLIYPNCPYDYCKSNKRVLLNLNHRDGSDAQCAFNRSLLLCGSCKAELSLSLGSSHCLTCPSYWPVHFIIITLVAAFAGVALVALLLLLNLTVAVGTLNGLILYANIISANKSILLPFSSPNFVTVIISWLNLDIGIDTCYFKGMDAYTKSWLQLAFPAYVLLLVAAVIVLCSVSSKFSNFIGKRDPVATLATLISLSYATILENTFRALTPGQLVYPNGTIETVWLPDATIKYFSGIHIPLFIAAVLILIIGIAYTVLLFSWQWLLWLPKWKIFGWIRNQRLHTFIGTYSIPYTPKHRYWTGLLLLARAILYLIAAANVSNDPHLRLTSIIFIVGGIIFLKSLAGYRLYKDSFIDIVEMIFYFNILTFATLTWYTVNQETTVHNSAIAYVSVIITLLLLVLVIIHHLSTYTTLLSRMHKTAVYQNLLKTLKFHGTGKPTAGTALPLTVNNNDDDDTERFNELMDVMECSVSINDFQSQRNDTAHSNKPMEPTCSTVVVISELEIDDDTERSNEPMDVLEGSAEFNTLNDDASQQNGTTHQSNDDKPNEPTCSTVMAINKSDKFNDDDSARLNDAIDGSSDQNHHNHSSQNDALAGCSKEPADLDQPSATGSSSAVDLVINESENVYIDDDDAERQMEVIEGSNNYQLPQNGIAQNESQAEPQSSNVVCGK